MTSGADGQSYTILGEEVPIPVEIRSATTWAATYLVGFDAAVEMIRESSLMPKRFFSHRAMVSLTFVRYTDGDLGSYHEFGVAVIVEPPAPGPGISPAGAYIHQLPVNQPFTLAAGREIWGFPKWMADIDIHTGGPRATCTLRADGTEILSLSIARGLPVPTRETNLDAYSCTDGIVRRTPWELDAAGTRARPGGARLRLGNHPLADELRGLGLPKAAVGSMSVARVKMRFGAPEVLTDVGSSLPIGR